MERSVEKMLKRVSVALLSIGTVMMVMMILQTPKTCISPLAPSKPHTHFPRSTCDSSPRHHLPLSKKNARLWSSKAWNSRVSSFSSYFLHLGFLSNHTKALCLFAGAGHAPMALSQIGLSDVTAVELVDSLPLVRRADPHNLPFFDDVFDFAFTSHLPQALYPSRFVREMERTVRRGGFCAVAVDECGGDLVRDIATLFHNSKLLHVANVTLQGSKQTSLLFQVKHQMRYNPVLNLGFDLKIPRNLGRSSSFLESSHSLELECTVWEFCGHWVILYSREPKQS